MFPRRMVSVAIRGGKPGNRERAADIRICRNRRERQAECLGDRLVNLKQAVVAHDRDGVAVCEPSLTAGLGEFPTNDQAVKPALHFGRCHLAGQPTGAHRKQSRQETAGLPASARASATPSAKAALLWSASAVATFDRKE